MKNCVACGTEFLRVTAPLRTLKDNSVIDPNLLCTKCESEYAKESAERAPRMNALASHTPSELRLMERECLRKDAFFKIATVMGVAKKQRRVHRGDNPVSFYRCRVKIDSILHPERAKKHWHLGGDRHRKI